MSEQVPDLPTLAAPGGREHMGKGRGQQQLRTYPSPRKARLSGTARVTVGSLGSSQAAGASLSRGSLSKRRQGVSGRPVDGGCRKGTQPFFPDSPWGRPDHLDQGNHGCQEHPRKKWRGKAVSGMGPEPPTVAAGRLAWLRGPSLQPQFLWSRSYSSHDSEGLISWASLHLSGKELKLCHVILGWGTQKRRKEPYPEGSGSRKEGPDIQKVTGLGEDTEPQGLDFPLQITPE